MQYLPERWLWLRSAPATKHVSTVFDVASLSIKMRMPHHSLHTTTPHLLLNICQSYHCHLTHFKYIDYCMTTYLTILSNTGVMLIFILYSIHFTKIKYSFMFWLDLFKNKSLNYYDTAIVNHKPKTT